MAKKSELRVGIIGVGGIAFGKHMPALAAVDNVKMTAFFDPVQASAERGAKEFGVAGAAITTSYQDLLALDLDVVHICTPNNSHAEIAIAAMEAGCHVMCEKPMATSAADARRMVETSRRTGKKLTIGYQNRYRPDTLFLKRVCEKRELGEIYYAKALALRRRAVPTWGVFLDKTIQGGGPLIDIGTHALDMTLWLMDNYQPEFVVGTAYQKLGKRKNAANAWGPWDPAKFTVEDSAFGFIKFTNGATVILESSWALNMLKTYESSCILCGTEAGAELMDKLRINGDRHNRMYTEELEAGDGKVTYRDITAKNASELEAKLWIDAIVRGKDPVVTPEQALTVTEILEAIYVSSETGKPVYFDEARQPVLA